MHTKTLTAQKMETDYEEDIFQRIYSAEMVVYACMSCHQIEELVVIVCN